jgi:hypothetical protein
MFAGEVFALTGLRKMGPKAKVVKTMPEESLSCRGR